MLGVVLQIQKKKLKNEIQLNQTVEVYTKKQKKDYFQIQEDITKAIDYCFQIPAPFR